MNIGYRTASTISPTLQAEINTKKCLASASTTRESKELQPLNQPFPINYNFQMKEIEDIKTISYIIIKQK